MSHCKLAWRALKREKSRYGSQRCVLMIGEALGDGRMEWCHYETENLPIKKKPMGFRSTDLSPTLLVYWRQHDICVTKYDSYGIIVIVKSSWWWLPMVQCLFGTGISATTVMALPCRRIYSNNFFVLLISVKLLNMQVEQGAWECTMNYMEQFMQQEVRGYPKHSDVACD